MTYEWRVEEDKSSNRNKLSCFFVCQKRLGVTSGQFGPMFPSTAEHLCDYLNTLEADRVALLEVLEEADYVARVTRENIALILSRIRPEGAEVKAGE